LARSSSEMASGVWPGVEMTFDGVAAAEIYFETVFNKEGDMPRFGLIGGGRQKPLGRSATDITGAQLGLRVCRVSLSRFLRVKSVSIAKDVREKIVAADVVTLWVWEFITRLRGAR